MEGRRGPGGGQDGGRGPRTVGLPLQVVLLHAVDGELVRRIGGGQRRRHQQQHGGQEDDEAERQARRLQHVLQHLARFLQHPGRRGSRAERRLEPDSGGSGGGSDGGGSRRLTSTWVAAGVLRAQRRAARARPGVLQALLRTSPRRAASWEVYFSRSARSHLGVVGPLIYSRMLAVVGCWAKTAKVSYKLQVRIYGDLKKNLLKWDLFTPCLCRGRRGR